MGVSIGSGRGISKKFPARFARHPLSPPTTKKLSTPLMTQITLGFSQALFSTFLPHPSTCTNGYLAINVMCQNLSSHTGITYKARQSPSPLTDTQISLHSEWSSNCYLDKENKFTIPTHTASSRSTREGILAASKRWKCMCHAYLGGNRHFEHMKSWRWAPTSRV